MLRHHRDIAMYERQQRAAQWRYELPLPSYERRVGIMGIGLLGGAAARMLAELGFLVAGWARSPHTIDGRRVLSRRRRARRRSSPAPISSSCLLPLTNETRHIVDRDALYRLPRGAKLVNCGRGGTVDEDALLAALHDGQIAEATLDVFETEPLPPSIRSGAWSRCWSCRTPPRSRCPRSPPETSSRTSAGCGPASRC